MMKSEENRERVLELLEHTDAAQRRRKIVALTLVGLALILLVVAVVWWRSLPNEEVALEETAVVPIALTGPELMAAYESDPGLTDFAEGPFVVTAPLSAAPTTGTTVLLSTADPLRDIAADVVATDATRLTDEEPGAQVALLCERIVPGLRAPRLEACRLALDRQ